MTLEELIVRFPLSEQADKAVSTLAVHRKLDPTVVAKAETQIPLLAEKWRDKAPEVAVRDVGISLSSVALTFAIGGAE